MEESCDEKLINMVKRFRIVDSSIIKWIGQTTRRSRGYGRRK